MEQISYTDVVSNHFLLRGAVDDHNKKRTDGDVSHGMYLETTQRTIRWENQVFCSIFSVIEVNEYLAMRYFGPLRKNIGGFCKNLDFDIFFNGLDMDYELKDSSIANTRDQKDRHELISAPPHEKFENGRWKKKNPKQDINNIVEYQGIVPTGGGLYVTVASRTLYAGHISVNTLLRKLQSSR